MERQRNDNNKKQSATQLVGFHFSNPAPQQRQQVSSSRPRGNYNNKNTRKQPQRKSTPQDRTSARRKANAAMFYLHTSGDHSFYLTRRSGSKVSGKKYSFEGSDQAVSWESVRLVKQLVPLPVVEKNEPPSCPICLDEYVCPRITKCGHTFCLSCLTHHVQSNAHSTNHVRCPCCSIPLLLGDLRPVVLETVVQPMLQKQIQLTKLHREKTCSAPYIPKPGCFKHCNPHAAPCMGDLDEKYSRFNYIDSTVYLNLLQRNLQELQTQEQKTPPNTFDYVFVKMALEIVNKQIHQATLQLDEERELTGEIMKPTSGFYQPQRALDTIRVDLESSVIPVDTEGTDAATIESSEVTNSPTKGNKNNNKNRIQRFRGSLYLDEVSAFQFYQAEDGQLIFLHGFNMTLLMSDFSRSIPGDITQQHNCPPPLPDTLQGRILELERKNLTPELRKRLSFLSHLPLFTDIVFVELDLNHMLSEKTKQKFKGDLAKRRKRRQSKVKADKRENRAIEQRENQAINDRKARLQLIDPNDEFFRSPVEEEVQLTADDFSAALAIEDSEEYQSPVLQPQAAPGLSFSQACRQRETDLVVSSFEAFPTLGSAAVTSASSGNTSKPRSGSWGEAKLNETKASVTSPGGGGGKIKKKGKAKQRQLFSTGGQRAGGY